MVRVTGPILECQLIETALLNAVNFQSLVATKAARVLLAARGDPVLEFGLRRAQGIDGGIAASRAAWVGGCSATSNVLAGRLFGIPVSGTHGHSWVMAFDDEMTAFRTYAKAMPNNGVFLVDTYDSRDGVRHGFGYCPEERKTDGIVAELTVRENIVLALQAKRGLHRPLSRREQDEIASRYVKMLDIRPPDPERPVGLLSGGFGFYSGRRGTRETSGSAAGGSGVFSAAGIVLPVSEVSRASRRAGTKRSGARPESNSISRCGSDGVVAAGLWPFPQVNMMPAELGSCVD